MSVLLGGADIGDTPHLLTVFPSIIVPANTIARCSLKTLNREPS